MARIVDKFMREMSAQLVDRNVAISLDETARAYLAGKGYDKHFGARPLARIIDIEVKRPLSNEILFGALAEGGTVRIRAEGETLTFEYGPPPPDDDDSAEDEVEAAPDVAPETAPNAAPAMAPDAAPATGGAPTAPDAPPTGEAAPQTP
jgi:ATP-dependent Clp protease ATP-binding subunit ClpA